MDLKALFAPDSEILAAFTTSAAAKDKNTRLADCAALAVDPHLSCALKMRF